MPQARNLVLKNAANVAKNFELITPASGYGGLAEWALKEGVSSNVFPRVTASAAPTKGSRPADVVKFKLRVPTSYIDPVTGSAVLIESLEVNVSATVPKGYPELAKDDAVAYATTLFQDTLVKAMIRDGHPAT